MPNTTRPTYAQILKEPRTYLMYVAITLCVSITVYSVKDAHKATDKAEQREQDCEGKLNALTNTLLIKNHIIDAIKNNAPEVDTTGAKTKTK